MLLKLSLLLSTIGIIACNVPFDTTKEVKYEETTHIQQRNYQHSEYLNSYTEVVYKYETNEVNSVDDLVVGNTYYMSQGSLDDCAQLFVINSCITNFGIYNLENTVYANYFDLTIDNHGGTKVEYLFNFDDYQDSAYTILFSYDFQDIVIEFGLILTYYSYNSSFDDVLTEYIKPLPEEYNVIESVIYHQPQTIIGYFNEFLEENLFSEIPYVRDMTFNVGGQNINFLTYLIILFGLVVSIGILFGLFLLLRWLFKIFANLFIMR